MRELIREIVILMDRAVAVDHKMHTVALASEYSIGRANATRNALVYQRHVYGRSSRTDTGLKRLSVDNRKRYADSTAPDSKVEGRTV